MGQHRQLHASLGDDTFRGTGSLGTRPLFFGKTGGQTDERSGLLKVASPVSGHTLTVPDGSGPNHHAAIKDPIAGTVLRLDARQAQVVTPVLVQPQVHSRKFYLEKDVDIAIATLRATNSVSDKTNEKLGTSGTATGTAVFTLLNRRH
jgi:hypothetical protein